ncbi:hypothetical protein FOVG_18101 [Fusarium oxysporum f. sp. pisi HDV247]|uniref:Uncharacterized protein n=1 Tax=Fusarium oxysporum f. sp. pisi HDV247 TaxID=1080344 RepID=W9NCP1_FUSOX|nr:hypothetical protein FOVG_18101 [Fusarium oxysporum f. sp. pisi HDV247]
MRVIGTDLQVPAGNIFDPITASAMNSSVNGEAWIVDAIGRPFDEASEAAQPWEQALEYGSQDHS